MPDLDLLHRIANGERKFSHPTQDLVDDLLELRDHGYIRMPEPQRNSMGGGAEWYFAAVIGVSDEGLMALRNAGYTVPH